MWSEATITPLYVCPGLMPWPLRVSTRPEPEPLPSFEFAVMLPVKRPYGVDTLKAVFTVTGTDVCPA
jgi:hypothetical protein